MEQSELCKMCNEYSIYHRCENRKKCKLLNILKENKAMRKEIKELKAKNADLSLRMSYMRNPMAIGDRCEMGG